MTTEFTEVLIEKSSTQTSVYSYGVDRISDGYQYYQTTRNATIVSTTDSLVKIMESYDYSDVGLVQQLGYGYN